MIGVSVIICCYNSAKKIALTLEHLAKQKVLPYIAFEIILVDNNCSDTTIKIAEETWTLLGRPFSLITITEVKPGLSFARKSGIQKSKYEYVILCDDDNWLCENYLQNVYSLFESMPDVSVIGGVGIPVADIPFPEWFIQMKGFGYAVGSEGRITGLVDAVYGAGMCLRKSTVQALLANDFCFTLTDRKGISLSSGGDVEICVLLKNAGHKIYLDTSLTFKHFLNKERLTWSYYLKLRRAFGKASAYLLLYSESFKQVPPVYKFNFREIGSILKFGFRNRTYIIFPNRYKNIFCADAVQHMHLRMTCLFEKKQMNAVINLIKKNKKGKTTINYVDII